MTSESKEKKLKLAKDLSYDIRRAITDFLSENIKQEGITKADWLLISNLGLVITSDYINKPFQKSSQQNETAKYLEFFTEKTEEKSIRLKKNLELKEKELDAMKTPPLGTKRPSKLN
jgi:hypothetical protein